MGKFGYASEKSAVLHVANFDCVDRCQRKKFIVCQEAAVKEWLVTGVGIIKSPIFLSHSLFVLKIKSIYKLIWSTGYHLIGVFRVKSNWIHFITMWFLKDRHGHFQVPDVPKHYILARSSDNNLTIAINWVEWLSSVSDCCCLLAWVSIPYFNELIFTGREDGVLHAPRIWCDIIYV